MTTNDNWWFTNVFSRIHTFLVLTSSWWNFIRSSNDIFSRRRPPDVGWWPVTVVVVPLAVVPGVPGPPWLVFSDGVGIAEFGAALLPLRIQLDKFGEYDATKLAISSFCFVSNVKNLCCSASVLQHEWNEEDGFSVDDGRCDVRQTDMSHGSVKNNKFR